MIARTISEIGEFGEIISETGPSLTVSNFTFYFLLFVLQIVERYRPKGAREKSDGFFDF